MRRRYLRASALAGLFGLITSVGLGVDLAAAHPGDHDQTDAEHAKQDLAGTSIEQIEGTLEDADVRLNTKDDNMLDISSALEPLVGDIGKIHAEFCLWMHCSS